MTVNTAVALPN